LELIELKTKIRTATGNGPARRLRMSGQIPAVLYGPKTEPVLISVDKSDLELLLKKGGIGQIVLNLVIKKNGETMTMPAMIKELQTHPVSRNFIHVDFYEIKMDQKITAKIPVITTGKAKGVELGGILQIVRREIEVECLPLAVPESIEIDISDLDIGDSIHVRDIKPEGEIEFLEEDDYTVVTVLAPKLEEEEEELEEEEEGEEEEAEKEEGETPEAGSEE
jgi:large subunit ribosomal protein L25